MKESLFLHLSQAQKDAFFMENQAYGMDTEGALYNRKAAKELREKDTHSKILKLFEYGDEQNRIIDIGLKTGKVPVV